MANKVTMKLPPRELKRADAVFSVATNGKKAGTLKISNGAVVWFPPYTKYGYKMTWTRFNEIMQEHARRFEER